MGRLRPSPGGKAAAGSLLCVPAAGHCGALAGVGRAGVSGAGSIIRPRLIGDGGRSGGAWPGSAVVRKPSRSVTSSGKDDGGGGGMGSRVGRGMGADADS
jgi:hypothetical protein